MSTNDSLCTTAHWLSTHGLGAIKDSTSTFSITAEQGTALLRPSHPDQLSGWVHFTIPSPPPKRPNLKKVSVDFSAQTAYVDAVDVYLANLVNSKSSGLKQDKSFALDFPTEVVYKGKGILVSVFIQFKDVSSRLMIESVGIEV
ncbi:hypothetical protein Daesc_009636 [Daldinia eschscholtzii]|uniref:Uncharacterized protein n=1 Tax=Daldinia eschscholtzii TaxID=292717 RepID=A0AAX6MAP8_9PEZI